MIGNYIGLLFNGLGIYRWNNYPRVEMVCELDNTCFVLQTALVLLHIQEKNWYKVNYDYVFKKTIISTFVKLIISDIDNSLKSDIKTKNPYLYKELEKKVLQVLLSFELPEWLKKDIVLYQDEWFFEHKNEFFIEDTILSYSKLFAGYLEAYFNSRVYDVYFQNILTDISQKMQDKKYKELSIYLDITKQGSDTFKYLLNVRKLQTLYRWNRLNRVYNISVMSHLYIVFVLTYFVSSLEGFTSKEQTALMKIALLHDIPECITWDIVSPTKKSIPWFYKLIEDIEKDQVDKNLFIYLKNLWIMDSFSPYIINPWKQEKWSFVKVADNFSALFESKLEANKVNDDFLHIHTGIKRELQQSNLVSVNYLLKFWLEYFDDNLDQHIRRVLTDNS